MGPIGSSTKGGYIYPDTFIGPIRPQDAYTKSYAPQGAVLGASTSSGGGGGGGGAQPAAGALDAIGNNVRSMYEEQLGRARSLYDARASELNNQLGGLGREKDTMLDRIGSTYRGLTQSAQDTLTKNVGALNNRRGEVEQTYDTSRTNVGRLLGDQQRMNRVMARAQGTLGSSYYGNMQSGAGREATQRIAGLNTEEVGKLDAIGDAILNAETDTNSKIQALKEEQALQERETINKYTTLANAIQNDLRFNERDRLEALDAVNSRLSSALDQISNTMMQYQAAAGNLGNVAGNWNNSIQSFNPFGTIQQTLDNSAARGSSVSPFASAVAAPGASANPTTAYYLNRGQQPDSYLDRLLA